MPETMVSSAPNLLDELTHIVGDVGLVTDVEAQRPYLQEWRERAFGRALAIVRPATTEHVAEIVRLCKARALAIVPQGGNTGLCGGAVPDRTGSQIVLSLDRLRSIHDVDPQGFTMTVDAGCTLLDVQKAAERVNRRFGLSIASEGSATIGGNIATNAGGIQTLRYGTMRDQVLGLEVVLPDGTIWDGCRRLRKNTAGYDLKQLFVGSEGTLGIVTRAVLELRALPRSSFTALLGVAGIEAAVTVHSALREFCGHEITALELISGRAMTFVGRYLPSMPALFDEEFDYVILLELESEDSPDLKERSEEVLASLIANGTIGNALTAKSLSESEHLWRMRHSISAAQKPEGLSIKHDISLPINNLADFHRAAETSLCNLLPGVRPVIFGHIGDGNLHYNVSRPKRMTDDEFAGFRDAIEDIIYSEVGRFDGTISAEHGIGRFKRERFAKAVPAVERKLMLAIKAALDPGHLMNPGALFNQADTSDYKNNNE